MNQIKPVSPNGVTSLKLQNIPEEVIGVFNALIAKDWNGHSATVKQEDAVQGIMKALKITRNYVFDNDYLEVEPIFREVGWNVEYDKPGYNETYPATFRFTPKKLQNKT